MVEVASTILKPLLVDKSKARFGELARVPRHISEYLLTKFDGDTIKASNFIRKYCPPQSDSKIVLHRIMSETLVGGDEAIILMDEVHVTPIPKIGIYSVSLTQINLGVEIYTTAKIIKDNLEVLRHGAWGTVALQYDYDGLLTGRRSIVMVGFKPLETAKVDLELFQKSRKEFSLEEWIELLMNTCGVNPRAYNQRQKLLYLSRLLPLIEENLHLLEFGARATGKTYIYRNLSRYARIFSGGGISPAVLFYNAITKTLGELGVRDAVVLDEISKIEFTEPFEMAGKLKDYMESNVFERGVAKQIRSGCSIVMQGNIDSDYDEWDKLMPSSLREPALIDRVNGLIPGWEIPKIMSSEEHLSKGYGISADYFSEILHQMRSITATKIIQERVELLNQPTIRDERAAYKIASAMYKLLRPDLEYDREVLEMSMDIAVEYRNRIRFKLHEMIPGEFSGKQLEWRFRDA
ncbi:MAG: BREX system Lon protease-like protein BrxL [Ignisphaera sp.]